MDKQSIIVTGGSKGLGLAISKQATLLGYSVAIVARDRVAIDKAVEVIGIDNHVTGHCCDLTDLAAVEGVFTDIVASHPHICGLVNNAATWTGGKSILEMSIDDIKNGFDLNFYSALYITKIYLKHLSMAKDKFIGRGIVNIGATASTRGGRNMAGFALPKSALRIFSQSLAKELGPEGLHVSHIILDGLIDNERTRSLNPNTPDNSYMKPESLAKRVLGIMEESPDVWTFEAEMRPYNEKW